MKTVLEETLHETSLQTDFLVLFSMNWAKTALQRLFDTVQYIMGLEKPC